jgi:hypothetical protein
MAQSITLWQPVNGEEARTRTVVNRAYLGALMTTAMQIQSAFGITFQRSNNFYMKV